LIIDSYQPWQSSSIMTQMKQQSDCLGGLPGFLFREDGDMTSAYADKPLG
jgi:hypothetical protein